MRNSERIGRVNNIEEHDDGIVVDCEFDNARDFFKPFKPPSYFQRRERIKRFFKRNFGLFAILAGWMFVMASCAIDATPNELTPDQRTAGELAFFGMSALAFGCGYMARGDSDDRR